MRQKGISGGKPRRAAGRRPERRRVAARRVVAGKVVTAGVVVAVGLLLLVVGFLQPWAHCPEIDDSAAGCPAGTVTRTVTAAGLGLLGLGTVLGLVATGGTRPRQRTGEPV